MVTKPAQGSVAAIFAVRPEVRPKADAQLQPADSSAFCIMDSDSELSQLASDDPIDDLKPIMASKPGNTQKAANAKAETFKSESAKGTPAKSWKKVLSSKDGMTNGTPKKAAKDVNGKSEAKIGEVAKKQRARPVKKPEVAVEPPLFEKVSTRMGRREAEQRIAVRYHTHIDSR